MSLRLQSVFQDLADIGISKNDLTADEIEGLVFACRRVDNPFDELNADLAEDPVKVCRGIYLWPLTAGALAWLEEYAFVWWPEGAAMRRWAKVYALRNARDCKSFAALTEKGAARRAILKCVLSLCCHRKELAVAVNKCYGIREHDAEDDTPRVPRNPDQADDFSVLVAALEVHSGIKAEHWLWGRSLLTMRKTYYRMRNMANALGGGKELEFEIDDALRNLARVKSMIVRRVKNEQGH